MSAELTKFVANDAFNQALTHPILSEHVFNKKQGPKVFSTVGWALVQKTPSIASILERNSKDIRGGVEYDKAKSPITMTNPDYQIPLSGPTKQILRAVFAVAVAILAKLAF